MSSESSLWTRLRDAVGESGHWERREFNPMDGVPDVSWCVHRIEGHIELKHIPDAPARPGTAVFGPRTNRGMRDTQIAWFNRRLRAGGRAHILAQVNNVLYLLHGDQGADFNSLKLNQMERYSIWTAGPQVKAAEWEEFLKAIRGPF